MGRSYGHLSLEERCEIARRLDAGESLRKIAASLDRAPSTISRELSRNTSSGPRAAPYKPAYAAEQTSARRWRGSRLERNEELQRLVLERMALGWSPRQVSGRLARERGHKVISYESIYRFIYAQIRRTNDFAWRRFLPRGKFKRGFRGRKGGSPVLYIKQRKSLEDRPAEAADRRQAGHWEGDLMAFAIYGQNLLAAHERTSRLIALARQPTKQADPVAQTLRRWLKDLPPHLRRTITFDNGTEFASHHRLHQLGLMTFFCEPHAPWQKGGIENAIGRLRRYLPRKTNLDQLSAAQLLACARLYNHTPRQCLDFQTPAEVFSQLLHLECDSTSRRSCLVPEGWVEGIGVAKGMAFVWERLARCA
jgi:IS30 family transposase